jgi:single-strand DNA-binding protein
VNQVRIEGRLGSDPKLAYSESGTPLARFSVATERRRQVNGEWQSDTTWVDCTVFGGLAENVCETLTKGTDILGTGRVETPRSYAKTDGTTGVSLPVILESVGPNLRWQTAVVTRIEKKEF